MTDEYIAAVREYERFAQAELAPRAQDHDRQERVDPELFSTLAERGYLAPFVSPEGDLVRYALLHEQIGRACGAIRTILTAHDMVAYAISQWGTDTQRSTWLPALTSGQVIAGFALSEPSSGSDGVPTHTLVNPAADGYRLNGHKVWVSGGQTADVFLVFARDGDGVTALLVPADIPGLVRVPVHGLLGFRGGQLADLRFDDCQVPADAVLGRAGHAHPFMTALTLSQGRLSVASGAVGLAQACLDASVAHADKRIQGGSPLRDHQLVQRMLSRMITNVEAARLLCRQAASLLDAGDPNAPMAANLAKHFAATSAVDAARDAVQIHGAAGCHTGHPVERYYRDAKMLEIIEGSNEIHEQLIGRHGYTAHGVAVGHRASGHR